MSTTYSSDTSWWRQATVYQIYPRSFADANGDGIGDLRGITSRVQYLESLNIDAVWLSPFYPSPLKDGGYDVADYRNVDPNIGTLDDFDEMIQAFKAANIKVIVDIVPNHCSAEHPWFQEALKSPRGSRARNRFHFRDGRGDDGTKPPNDWTSLWGQSLWEPVGDGQFYCHMFDASQPDFNWENDEVRADFLSTLRFWGDRGVSGFRVDVAQSLAKDMSEPYMSDAEAKERFGWIRQNGKPRDYHPLWDRDQVFEIYRDWRKVFNEYEPPLTAVGEILVSHDRVPLYASPDGLGQAFAFDIQKEAYNADAYRKTIDALYHTAKKSGSTTTWVLSNHDVVRHATRFGVPQASLDAPDIVAWNDSYSNELLINKGKEVDASLGLRRARAAMLFLLSLPGSTYIYQGEELGLPEVIEFPDDKRQDPIFVNGDGSTIGRDGCRMPIPWTTTSPAFGFTAGEPWLAIPEWFKEYSVESETGNHGSTLSLYRSALRLRRQLQDMTETMTWVERGDGVLHIQRPGGWHALMNMGRAGVVRPPGELLIASGTLEGDQVPVDTTVWVRTETSVLQ